MTQKNRHQNPAQPTHLENKNTQTTQIPEPLPTLKKFEISGLHGDRDLVLRLDENVKILVDENGSGKTTLISMLFYILSDKLYRLARFSFEKILFTFSSGESIYFTKDELTGNDQPRLERFHLILKRVIDRGGEKMRAELVELFNRPAIIARESPLVKHIAQEAEIPVRVVWDILRDVGPSILARPAEVEAKFRRLSELLPYPVLYFPTFRRVEEDLNSIGYPEKEFTRDEELIQFGMQDVKKRLDGITAEIRASSVEWYSIVNGRMISQLVDGIQVTEEMRKSVNAPAALSIVLDRIGENIADAKKQSILRIVSAGQIGESKYEPLVYFLSNLMQIYEKQRERDDDIKAFARVVNGYLRDKEVRYNESKLSITVAHKRTGQEVRLDNLSSGEKQIVSTFSKLYFTSNQSYIILFDEPELSLSMEWQKKLLHDIMQSGRCSLLIAATHSPFVFENELDKYASQLELLPRDTNVSA